MPEFGKRRGYVVSVTVNSGAVVCKLEDVNTPNKTYEAIYGNNSATSLNVPRIGTEVVVESIDGEKVVTSVLSIPADSGGSENDMEVGAVAGHASMSFVFGPREGANGPEGFSVEYRDGGYVFDLDVDGDVTINAGGDVKIKEGGTAKRVLTEDAVFEYEDTGDTSDGTASATTKKTSKVVNGETTEVELE